MYSVYLDKLLLPITPSKIQININNQNSTLSLINDGEVNILKKAKLSDIDFDILLPQSPYPFAVYKDGFKKASYFLDEIEKLKTGLKPFQFIVVRAEPNGSILFNTNIKVALEDYKITEDVKNGFDVSVSIKLKQYREYGTKTFKVSKNTEKNTETATIQKNRPSDKSKIGIGSNVVVNGRLHRDSAGNGAGQSKTNYRAKVNFINEKGKCPYHVATPDGSWLGWVSQSSVKGV